MSYYDLLSMALRNLWKRKLRTFLTVLGVIIGTASIVVMVSIGLGINQSYKEQLEQMGSLQVINVSVPYNSTYSYRGGGVMISASSASNSNSSNNVVLDNNAINEFKQIPNVEAVTPVVSDWGFMLIAGKYVSDVNIMGIDPDTMEAMGYKLADGRFLTPDDGMVMVVGQSVGRDFYNPKLSGRMRWMSPPPEVNLQEEDKLKITYDYAYGTKEADKKVKPYKVELVGTLSGYGEDSYSVVMPLKQVEKMIADKKKYEDAKYNNSNQQQKAKKGYDNVKVKVKDINSVKKVQEQIKEMGYEAYSLTEYLESMQEGTKMLQMGLGAIGAVSLLVAAIGIANTMIMSIYERTKEIGVMKVIGASLQDIRRLFLTEAAFIGFSGGAVGTALSYGLSYLIKYFGASSVVPLWLAGASLIFATLVGILAGFFPARRAMRLSALTAIRTE